MEREQRRYDFLAAREGETSARLWMADLARTYRRAVLSRPRTLYRRELIESYLSAKRIARAR